MQCDGLVILGTKEINKTRQLFMYQQYFEQQLLEETVLLLSLYFLKLKTDLLLACGRTHSVLLSLDPTILLFKKK